MDPSTLIPIANNLILKRYKIGEVILRTGDDVDCMRIINHGRVKVSIMNLSDLGFLII